jgi:uncharacterized SAM-dependent methyltransferase
VVSQFAHRAFYNAREGRIEMHLDSRRDQVVRVGNAEFFFAAGESVRTEYSYKYSISELTTMAEAQGFAILRVWADQHKSFGVLSLAVSGAGH